MGRGHGGMAQGSSAVLWRGCRALLSLALRFDGPDQKCSKCNTLLPTTFYHIRSSMCISCKSEMEHRRASQRRKLRFKYPSEKRCKVCQLMLPAEQYHKCVRHPTGLTSYCIACHRKAVTSTTEAHLKMPIPKELHVARLRCTSCRQVKERSEFPVDRRKSQSLYYECKECCSNNRIKKRIQQLAEQELALVAAAEGEAGGSADSTPAAKLTPYRKRIITRFKASVTPPSATADGDSDKQVC